VKLPDRHRAAEWGRRAVPIIMPAVALVLIAWVYFLGVRSERTGFVDRVLDPGIKRLTHPVLNAFRGRPPEVPLLRVEWPPAASGTDSTAAPPVPGWTELPATYNGDTVLLLVDLDGAAGPDDALRLRLPAAPWGMTTATARPATSDAPLWAWWFTAVQRAWGAPMLATELVEVDMGDRAGGLHLMEQEMDSAWLAAHGALVAVALDDALLANARHAMARRDHPARPPAQADWSNAPVRMVQAAQGAEGVLAAQRAVERLEAFRSGSAPASTVLNTEAAARLMALCDVMGAAGTMQWWNFWFVPDSATGRLTMVPMRIEAGRPTEVLQVLHTSAPLRWPMEGTSFHDRLFGDPVMHHAYMACLDSLSDPEGWTGTRALLAEDLEHRYRIVQAEYPGTVLDLGVMDHGRSLAHQELHPADPVLAHTQGAVGGHHRLVVASVHSLPVVVHGAVSGTDTVPARPPQLLWPRRTGSPLSFVPLHLQLPVRPGEAVQVLAGVQGIADTTAVPVRAWSTLPASTAP
jgi:hypothetical protein